MINKNQTDIALAIKIALLTCQGNPERAKGVALAARQVADTLCTGQSKNHFLMLCGMNPFETP